MKKHTSIIFAVAATTILFLSFSTVVQDEWEVPEKYETMKNPLADDKGSISEGKALYVLHCKSCHGKEGLGDGPKAAQLDTPSGDFTDEDFQAQSDGVLFYKTMIGFGDMPSFEKKMDADELWSTVNYLRTLE